jgi:hypothetical protein
MEENLRQLLALIVDQVIPSHDARLKRLELFASENLPLLESIRDTPSPSSSHAEDGPRKIIRRARHGNYSKRNFESWEQVDFHRKQGVSINAIARILGMPYSTVRVYYRMTRREAERLEKTEKK